MQILIETERLLLRKITLDDKEDLFKLHSHPDVQIYTGEPVVESIEENEKAIRIRMDNYEKYGFDSLQIRKIIAIALKENKASIRE